MHVRTLMENHPDWLELLQDVYKIKVTRDGDRVSLKYNMLESPMAEPIVQECRGMVVDTAQRTILAHPYNKFWNLGDAGASPIDWATARVQEKLDGSLMILFWDPATEDWRVASSGHPTAGGSFGDSTTETFQEAFWRVFGELGMRLPSDVCKSVCFMFEFCAAENRIVVRHDKPRIVAHGARVVPSILAPSREVDRLTLEQLAREHRWEIVQEYPITSIAECLTAVEALDPIQTEGFVVVDGAFNRVKIKSPRYVILHHMKGDFTPRRAIELWQSGEVGELLGHFPEMAPQILPIHERLDVAAHDALNCFLKHRDLPTRKDFALAVKDLPWAPVAFLLHKAPEANLEHTKSIMRGLTTAALERLLERVPF